MKEMSCLQLHDIRVTAAREVGIDYHLRYLSNQHGFAICVELTHHTKNINKYSLILGLVPCIVFEGEDGVIAEKGL